MEIRLMDKNPETGRFVNVEIYTEETFENVMYDCIAEAVSKMSFFDRIRGKYDKTVKKALKNVFFEFEKRLIQNKN